MTTRWQSHTQAFLGITLTGWLACEGPSQQETVPKCRGQALRRGREQGNSWGTGAILEGIYVVGDATQQHSGESVGQRAASGGGSLFPRAYLIYG